MADVDQEVWEDVVRATLSSWIGKNFAHCSCIDSAGIPGGRCAKHIEFLWRKRFKDDLVTQFLRSEPWLHKADRLRLRDMMVSCLEAHDFCYLLANTSSSKARVNFPDGSTHRVTGIAMGIRRRVAEHSVVAVAKSTSATSESTQQSAAGSGNEDEEAAYDAALEGALARSRGGLSRPAVPPSADNLMDPRLRLIDPMPPRRLAPADGRNVLQRKAVQTYVPSSRSTDNNGSNVYHQPSSLGKGSPYGSGDHSDDEDGAGDPEEDDAMGEDALRLPSSVSLGDSLDGEGLSPSSRAHLERALSSGGRVGSRSLDGSRGPDDSGGLGPEAQRVESSSLNEDDLLSAFAATVDDDGMDESLVENVATGYGLGGE